MSDYEAVKDGSDLQQDRQQSRLGRRMGHTANAALFNSTEASFGSHGNVPELGASNPNGSYADANELAREDNDVLNRNTKSSPVSQGIAPKLAASGSSWSHVNISGDARVQLGHSFVTNNIALTAELARDVFRSCRVSSSFHALADEVAVFKTHLEMTEDFIQKTSPDEQDMRKITVILSTCTEYFREVKGWVDQFERLPTSSQTTWERTSWKADEIAELQSQLRRNTVLLNMVNTQISNSSQAAFMKMMQKFVANQEMKGEGSVISTKTVDSLLEEDREAWRLLRRELEDVGITPSIFDKNKELILSTLRKALETNGDQGPLYSDHVSEHEDFASETSSISWTSASADNEPFPPDMGHNLALDAAENSVSVLADPQEPGDTGAVLTEQIISGQDRWFAIRKNAAARAAQRQKDEQSRGIHSAQANINGDTSGAEPLHDRWLEVRKNAAARAAQRLKDEQSRGIHNTQIDSDGETSSEEAIAIRVARIKARVAELTSQVD